MSEATIRTAIYNAINDVSGRGIVHSYERWAAEWGAFLDLFKTVVNDKQQVRGWEVAYRGFNAIRDPQFTRLTLREHQFIVQGYMSLNDGDITEKTFAALAEDMCDAIDADTVIHSTPYRDASPAGLIRLEPRTFGSVLCHFAQIAVTVTEEP